LPDQRTAFLEMLASYVIARRRRSAVHRAIVEPQRAHFDPPNLSHAGGVSKYR
jgi:hypothetical protein